MGAMSVRFRVSCTTMMVLTLLADCGQAPPTETAASREGTSTSESAPDWPTESWATSTPKEQAMD